MEIGIVSTLLDWGMQNSGQLFSGGGALLVGATVTAVYKMLRGQRAKKKRIEDARARAEESAQRQAERRRTDVPWMSGDVDREDLSERGFDLRCSFCNKGSSSVKKIVYGPGVNICDECLERSLDETDADPRASAHVFELCEFSLKAADPKLPPEEHVQLQWRISELASKLSRRRHERAGDNVAGAKLIRPIGVGNFGTVWEASPLRPKFGEQRVAVKIFDQNKLAMGVMLWRFQRGLRALRIFHDLGEKTPSSIIRLGSISDDFLSFSMQYMPGGDLQTLARRHLSFTRKMELFEQIVTAVVFSHGHGIIHRDIKPANVLTDSSGDAVLTDFDIADLTFAHTKSMLSGGLGTPQFAAPEQLLGANLVAHPTADIFSLGKMLLFLISEMAPPMGSLDSDMVPQYLEGVDPRYQKLIVKCLQTDPNRRPQTASDLLAEFSGGAA